MIRFLKNKLISMMGLNNNDAKETFFVYTVLIACIIATLLGCTLGIYQNMTKESYEENTISVYYIETVASEEE